jgi:hypothetical protein
MKKELNVSDMFITNIHGYSESRVENGKIVHTEDPMDTISVYISIDGFKKNYDVKGEPARTAIYVLLKEVKRLLIEQINDSQS